MWTRNIYSNEWKIKSTHEWNSMEPNRFALWTFVMTTLFTYRKIYGTNANNTQRHWIYSCSYHLRFTVPTRIFHIFCSQILHILRGELAKNEVPSKWWIRIKKKSNKKLFLLQILRVALNSIRLFQSLFFFLPLSLFFSVSHCFCVGFLLDGISADCKYVIPRWMRACNLFALRHRHVLRSVYKLKSLGANIKYRCLGAYLDAQWIL